MGGITPKKRGKSPYRSRARASKARKAARRAAGRARWRAWASRAGTQRAYRARYRQGRVRPHIEFDFAVVHDWVVRKKFLTKPEPHSVQDVAEALGRAVEVVILRYL
jgi:hypothetical protein